MTQLSDPTDLDGLRQALKPLDPEGRLKPLGLKRVVISGTAHLEVAAALREALGRPSSASVVILTDKTPILRAGERLSALVASQLADGFSARLACLDDGHDNLHADETVLAMAAEKAKGADAIVTIGSGTMTDIGKIAADRNGGIPHVAVQTAASVDGFTDNVSVILRNGVKRTVPSRWPTIVLADVVTIGTAPLKLNTAGFGEAISLFTAPADWYLSSLLGLDSTFHPAALAMLQAAAAEPPGWSSGLATGEPASIRELTRLLAVRGIVSGVADTTACLSGVEHVISHMLDLHHAAHHEAIGLHGAQVGVASLIAAKLWRRAIETDLIRPGLLNKPDIAKIEARIEKAFSHLGPGIVEECQQDARAKHAKVIANWDRFVSVTGDWQRHAAAFGKLVLPAEALRSALSSSGGPSAFQKLDPVIPPGLARWATANCFLMRNRFNLVDLLDMMGLWTDELIDWALSDVMEAT
ncbi:iron-containing alcohol dehydrogenase [Aestuariivirga sp.]|jgi:glycerol-1-phosphate dehydrogenase [NAD(P)+]|uniref:iron-containing alcohol dehydrogenase n=1 Tax=Aestuariivirga sp. TaxID=2650926 RepID=UPI00378446D5